MENEKIIDTIYEIEAPDLDYEPEVKRKNYSPSEFISRGCSCCPQAYQPVSKDEMNKCAKLNIHNWISKINIPFHEDIFDCVEVRFKNSHKDFYRVPEGLEICEGDVVAVEGTPGHDIGIVTLYGELCRIQMRKKRISPDSENIKKLFRRAKPTDIEKWASAISKENTTLFESRKLAQIYNLNMKVNDVEYQGDDAKAIFYYTADDRVDFRQLIKALAEVFRVRVEMKQIGARQEASKLGGIGTCGRELCCCTWMNNFKSVSTSLARTQQIVSNPQKLAGQCGKLKCCLNYEYEVYAEALKEFPKSNIVLQTTKGKAFHIKTDIFRKLMWYSYSDSQKMIPLHVKDVKFIIDENRNNRIIDKLEDYEVHFDNGNTASSSDRL
jgi:cell fate regulator YaaT (PSP1 superfamily)